jgi:hypothetical protein
MEILISEAFLGTGERDFQTRILIKDVTDKPQQNLYLPCFEVILKDHIINRVYERQGNTERCLELFKNFKTSSSLLYKLKSPSSKSEIHYYLLSHYHSL